MDMQSELNRRLNETIAAYEADCEGELALETILAALEDAVTDATLAVEDENKRRAALASLYYGEKRAGMLSSDSEYRQAMLDAGRAHLLPR